MLAGPSRMVAIRAGWIGVPAAFLAVCWTATVVTHLDSKFVQRILVSDLRLVQESIQSFRKKLNCGRCLPVMLN